MSPAAVCNTSSQPMVTTTLTSAGRPVSGRIVSHSMTNPRAAPVTIAASAPTQPGAPRTVETS